MTHSRTVAVRDGVGWVLAVAQRSNRLLLTTSYPERRLPQGRLSKRRKLLYLLKACLDCPLRTYGFPDTVSPILTSNSLPCSPYVYTHSGITSSLFTRTVLLPIDMVNWSDVHPINSESCTVSFPTYYSSKLAVFISNSSTTPPDSALHQAGIVDISSDQST